MEKDKYVGAEWVRIDLHLHSPEVDSFTLPTGVNVDSINDREKVAREYVEKLKDTNIKVCAITDYNQISKEWYEPIKQEANKEGIIILPGLELSFNEGKHGLHILAIFDIDNNIEGINRFIYSLDKNPSFLLTDAKARSHRDINAKSNSFSALEELKNKFQCLIIIPHPEDDNGLFKTFQPNQIADYLKLADGIEPLSKEQKDKIISTGKVSDGFFGRFATIENSDPKSLDEIANKKREGKIRATYLKLSDFTLNALKLALHDPEVRLRLYESPKMIHDRIKKIIINGTTFLKNIDLNMNPEMNTLIGGRGVGKSAIIEALRYCMDLPVYHDIESREKFVHSVVGSGGEIIVELERHYGDQKMSYQIRRIIGQNPELWESDGNKLSMDTSSLFDGKPPLLIGQKELYPIALDRSFLLKLIDELIGEDIRKNQRELKELVEKLNGNGNEIIKLKDKLTKKDEYEQQLKTLEDQIKEYEKLGVVDKLKRLTDVLEDNQKVAHAFTKVEEIITNIKDVLESTKEEFSSLEISLARARSEGREIIFRIREVIKDMKMFAENSISEIISKIEDKKLDQQKLRKEWDALKSKVEMEVEEIKKELGEKHLKPEKLEEITKQKAKLEPLIEEIKKIDEQTKQKQEERTRIKQNLKQKRHELFKVRESEIEKVNKILKERMRLRVEYEKDTSDFAAKFKNLLSGSGVHSDALDKILSKEEVTIDGLLLSEYVSEGVGIFIEKFDLTDKMAEKTVNWLKEDRVLFELEPLFPDDRVIVELKVEKDFKDIENLSPGQKATALLLLLFAHEDRILILDQPEEDLDNRFVYEDVVKILREFKERRQFLIATHNANIPVIGDSELVIVLEAAAEHCKIIEKGSIDKEVIKDCVKNIMEGGEEAFRRRAEKYGGI